MATGTHLLILLRHGIAEEAAAGQRDEDRRLTGEGKRKTREVAAGMRGLDLPVDVILTSPLRRARETAAIVADVYDLAEECVEVVTALAPARGPEAVFKALAPHRTAAGVVLVGHEPDMGELTSTLLVGTPGLLSVDFKKAGLAVVSVAALPPRSAGVLELFTGPGPLRRIGRTAAARG
jgi:phosphohistidine phosphatase